MKLLRFRHNVPRTASGAGEVMARIAEDLAVMNQKRRFLGEHLEMGPNFVHAMIERGPSGQFGPPGEVIDLGWSHNLKTTVGMDWLHYAMGGRLGSLGGSPATASSATSITGTGTTLTASAHIGQRVFADNAAAAPVYGNIGANTTSALTVDQWWNADDTLGTTPGATAVYGITSGQGAARFLGLTTSTAALVVGDTVLAGEITTGGLARALATFAHTGGATTYTLSKTFTASATHTNVHRAGNFTASTTAAAGVLVAESDLNADATLASGDSLAVTWTWTLPAAG